MTQASIMNKIKHSIKKIKKTGIVTIVVYAVALLYFFPILYMFLTGFKTEFQAVKPSLLFVPTLETFARVLSDKNMYGYLRNSGFQVIFGTLISLALGVPAAFILTFGKFKKKMGEKIYFWFITTILLPPVAVLIPLYTWFQKFKLNEVPEGLLIVYVGFHVPLVVWMVYSFFKDVPVELIEASELDGCTRFQQLVLIAIPLAKPGIITAGLLVAVFIWNEFFLGFSLTGNLTATLPVYMSRFREQQGMFVAQLSASSVVAKITG